MFKILFAMVSIFILSLPRFALAEVSQGLIVEDKTFVFDEPSANASPLRALYKGELVQVIEVVETQFGHKWVKIKLGFDVNGFVAAERVKMGEGINVEAWKPPRILRDEKPISLFLRFKGETYGAAMGVRFQALSRFGVSASVGSVLEEKKMVGTSVSGGVFLVPVLWDFSPIVEVGFAKLSSNKKNSILRLTNLFVQLSGEWIFNSGYFIGGGVSYHRSTDIEVSAEYSEARNRPIQAENYGVIDPGNNTSFIDIRPLVTIGYSF